MRYERRRNEATVAEYRENIAAARFTAVSPELLQLRLALRGNQEDTNRFVMALEGMIPPEQFSTLRTCSGFWSTPKQVRFPCNRQRLYLNSITLLRPSTMCEQEHNRVLRDAAG
jgi:hypothetical protein